MPLSCNPKKNELPKNNSPIEKGKKLEWFNEVKYGLFIHWGLYASPAGEWNGEKGYAVLDIAKKEVKGKRGALEEKEGKLVPKKEIKDLLNSVISLCDLNGVTRIHEWHTPPREYSKKCSEFLKDNSN